MHPEVRRKDRILEQENTFALLNTAEYGTLASSGPLGGADHIPYATPISYIFESGCVYFHCASVGHKLTNIQANPNVCFSVVGKTRPVFDGDFTTVYESAVVFGKAEIVEDEQEKTIALTKLCEKYLPDYMGAVPASIERSMRRTCVVKITPERITGKAKKEPDK